jgi:hemoglobin
VKIAQVGTAWHNPQMSWEKQVTATLGEVGLRNLVSEFYRRIREDDLIGPMYPPDDWEGSEKRLADFICFRIAGNPIYTETRGHPRLRMRHMPFKIDETARDRWLILMGGSMDALGIGGEEREALDAFFFQVADFMRNHG